MAAVGTTHSLKVGTKFLMIRPGSYMRKPAPQFGPRFTGGDPDFNNLAIWQHWAQRCWVGGMDAPLWTDDAMYDDGVGVTTVQHEKMSLARDLQKGIGAGWTPTGVNASVARRFVVYNSILYFLNQTASGTTALMKYTASTDAWTAVTSFAANFLPRCVAAFDGKLYVGGILSGVPKLYYGTGALTSWTVIANPALMTSSGFTPRAMRSFGGKIYVAYGAWVWRGKDDQTWDGSTVFYKASMNSESNFVVSMETHLGFLYMLSNNGHIHRTDGNNTFDIWSWDGGTIGVALRSYDGKLFVSTYEYTETADVGFGVLYQFTGSAVTQLKRWGKLNQATSLGNLVAFDRKLFYGASNLLGMQAGFGVAAYDSIEDAHSIFASNSDTVTYSSGGSPYPSNMVDDVAFFGGYLFATVRAHGIFKTRYAGIVRDDMSAVLTGITTYDITTAGAALVPLAGGWFTTSTYDAGTPGIRKLWRKVSIDAAIQVNTGMVVEYSINNGVSWVALTPLVYTTGVRLVYERFINNVQSSSIKLRITMRSTNSANSPALFGYLVSYIMVPEPNWQWVFSVPIVTKTVLLDKSVETIDTEAYLAYFNGLQRAEGLVDFIDLDGVSWGTNGPGVIIYDMQVRVYDTTRPYEAEIVFTLVEAVETY